MPEQAHASDGGQADPDVKSGEWRNRFTIVYLIKLDLQIIRCEGIPRLRYATLGMTERNRDDKREMTIE